MRPRTPPGPAGALARKLADLWLRDTAELLSRWGHGIVAPDLDSAGIAISGLANARGCCALPQPLETCTGAFTSNSALTANSVCLSCRRQLPVTLWARWDSPGAVAVASRLAHSSPRKFAPARLTDHQRRVNNNRLPQHRIMPPLPPIPTSPWTRRRAHARWHAAGLPTPAAAVAAAADRRGAQQSLHAASAHRRGSALLADLARIGDALTVPDPSAAFSDLVRIGTDQTHGVTLFEPELIVGDDPAAVSVAWLSPADEHGSLVVPAALPLDGDPHRTRHDERCWEGTVVSQHSGTAHSIDAAGLALRAIPYPLLRAGILRPHRNRGLAALYRSALNGGAGTDNTVDVDPPRWLTGEDVENRLRDLLITVPEPHRTLDLDNDTAVDVDDSSARRGMSL